MNNALCNVKKQRYCPAKKELTTRSAMPLAWVIDRAYFSKGISFRKGKCEILLHSKSFSYD